MAYNADIPQASDDPSQSQGQILANFQELNTFLSVNHVSLNDGDQGKHNFLQLPEQGAAPTTAANEAGFYSASTAAGSQLFFREESNGTIRQLTNPPKTTIANTGTAGGNMTYQDSPMVFRIIWGLTNAFSGTATVQTPGGSGNILGYSCIANDASSAVTGAIASGVAPQILTIATPASISVRYIIYTSIT